MILQHYKLTANQLMGIPNPERALMLLPAHALNEINTLDKLVMLSVNFPLGNEVKERGQTCQSMVLTRTLVGKLHAFNELVNGSYNGANLGSIYQPLLDDSTKIALKEMGIYFGRSDNIMSAIRRKLAFHYDGQQGLVEIDPQQPASDLSIYLHKDNANSLYQFAELAITKALIELKRPGISIETPVDVLERLMRDIRDIINIQNEIAHGLIFAILDRHIGVNVIRDSFSEIDIGEVPNSANLGIPYFVQDDRRTPKSN